MEKRYRNKIIIIVIINYCTAQRDNTQTDIRRQRLTQTKRGRKEEGGGGMEGDRQTDRERERNRDRQTDRGSLRDRNRETGRQTEKQ